MLILSRLYELNEDCLFDVMVKIRFIVNNRIQYYVPDSILSIKWTHLFVNDISF